MPTKVKNFKPKRKPKTTKYPWAKWLRVGTWKIKKGREFTCALATMADNIRRTARIKGKEVTVWQDTKKQTIVFRVKNRVSSRKLKLKI